ncbi:glycosyltransferase family 2 protein [Lysobacter sp. CW239]|uniref:glycosyltransferase family 2 protein n=1 Tax=Lysobacteraceae TaxID=32033 RepID=UPI00068F67E8|nr:MULTISPECIES: glycosyltransferase family 2 protein [Lysobacter]QOD92033.1 glycosyltransferase family 2 protein [Lysobacter sp. CW239]
MNAALIFWLCIAMVAYAYAGYPLLVALLARYRGSTPLRQGLTLESAPSKITPLECIAADSNAGNDTHWPPPLTVVVAACNEEARIAGRVRDVLAQDYPADRLWVHVVSDGSTDRTAQAADIGDPRVTVRSLPGNVGKAAALNAALTGVDTGLVAFTDARQRFAPGALRHLVAAFADPAVGGISGELMIAPHAHDPRLESVGLYWRMEKSLRANEARLGWLHGVSGSIHALRRELFRPLPAGTVLDDMWLPLQVLLGGHRIWMERDAIAWDSPSGQPREEFQRKLRTLAGNWQLLARLPVLIHPSRNPVFFAWFSHKFLRLLVPWALLMALVASALAPGPLYRGLFLAQLLAYAWAIAGLRLPRLAARIPLLPTAGTFLMLNLAALLALPVSLAWQPSQLWKKH